jgi:hypothetical protein
MGNYLKHQNRPKKREPKKKPQTEAISGYERLCEQYQREATNLGGIEYALESLADHVGRYVDHAHTDGHNSMAVFTGPEGSGYYPVLTALEPTSESTERLMDALERIASAFERIADAMGAKRLGEAVANKCDGGGGLKS